MDKNHRRIDRRKNKSEAINLHRKSFLRRAAAQSVSIVDSLGEKRKFVGKRLKAAPHHTPMAIMST
jgi:hypothetical protein